MKKMFNKIIVAVLLVTFAISCTCISAYADDTINVTIDGEKVNFPDAKPFIDENNRTLIPVRFVSEELGAYVEWDEQAREVYIIKDYIDLTIKINDKNIISGNRTISMDTAAIIRDGRTYVPIRYVAEELGAKVSWNGTNKTVLINNHILSGKRICIDPGHGGTDSGAEGRMAVYGLPDAVVYEKQLIWTFASDLKDALEDEGATVLMTRTDDYDVSVTDRWKFATNKNVDAFISVHFDFIKSSPGTHSYYGQTRPKDKYFAQTIHNAVINVTGNPDKGVWDDTHTAVGRCGVLNGGGDYPRVLIEANCNDLKGVYGVEFSTESKRFSRGAINGLKAYFVKK